ncbi:glycosyltransferase [Candidatus Saccharibacteria bacterium]|nr:glycosyltransferase [Candidatus Saccharibacteria bacterium]
MRTKKVAIISEHASPLAAAGGTDAGGQNVAVGQLARKLVKAGWRPDVFTRRDDVSLPDVTEWQDGVRVIYVPAGPAEYTPKESLLPYMAEFMANTLRFMEREQHPYELVHAHFFMSGLVAAVIKQTLGLPFAVTFHALGKVRLMHQGVNDQFPEERLAIEERVIREADRVVALCPQDRQDLVDLYDADPAKIVTIPNGYDPDELHPVDKQEARERLGIVTPQPVILQLGRLVPRKGVDTVIQALGTLRRTGVRAHLLIAGGETSGADPELTPEIGRLMRVASDEGLEGSVTFLGRRDRDELKYWYSAADVFVTVPWYEPFGITPLEAMACGTPVVGSAVGGIKYTIEDGKSGLLVPPKDPEALAEALSVLLAGRNLHERLSQGGLERVKDFTWQNVAAQTASMYQAILEDYGIDKKEQSSWSLSASETK